jgi:hypothetical protein
VIGWVIDMQPVLKLATARMIDGRNESDIRFKNRAKCTGIDEFVIGFRSIDIFSYLNPLRAIVLKLFGRLARANSAGIRRLNRVKLSWRSVDPWEAG